MPSSLSWIDQDDDIRSAVLELVNMPGVLDELGLGTIRDSISDTLFPGMSTLHTRLRYVYFVKWTYKELETEAAKSKSEFDFGAKLREAEKNLTKEMLDAKSGETGIIGSRTDNADVKVPPSSIYWTALSTWNILLLKSNQPVFHKMLANRRNQQSKDNEADLFPLEEIWNHHLPGSPNGFPKFQLGRPVFELTLEEAVSLRDCIRKACPDSLFAFLLEKLEQYGDQYKDKKYPWDLLGINGFFDENDRRENEFRKLLEHARRYSLAVTGALRLYGLLLAKEYYKNNTVGKEETIAAYRNSFESWWNLSRDEIRVWDLAEFFSGPYGNCPGHNIVRNGAKKFLTKWVEILQDTKISPLGNPDADELVKGREKVMKQGKSRFDDKNIEQWTPSLSKKNDQETEIANMYDFRWSHVRSHLEDLYEAVKSTTGEKHA